MSFVTPYAAESWISLLAGNLPPSIACAIRAFGQRRRNDSRDAARVVSAARLRQLGFRIEHTPQDLIPDHVSAYWDDGPWDAKVAELFCRAFRAPVSQTEGAA